jgi:hypothetical protein
LLEGYASSSSLVAWSSLCPGANNFTDITNSTVLSEILGFSHEDVKDLIAGLDDTNSLKHDREGTFDHLKDWYNGYCFDGLRSVFHPFGVLSFLIAAVTPNTTLQGMSATSWLKVTEADFLDNISKEIVEQDQSARVRTATLDFSEMEGPGKKKLDMRCLLYQIGYLTEIPGSGGCSLMVPNEHTRNIIKELVSRAEYAVPKGGTSILGDIFARRDIAAFGRIIRDTLESTPMIS